MRRTSGLTGFRSSSSTCSTIPNPSKRSLRDKVPGWLPFIAQPLDRQQWDAQLCFIHPKELNPLVEVKPSSPPMLEGKALDSQMCQKKLNGGANPVRRRPAMAPIRPKCLDQLQSKLARTRPRYVDQSRGRVRE